MRALSNRVVVVRTCSVAAMLGLIGCSSDSTSGGGTDASTQVDSAGGGDSSTSDSAGGGDSSASDSSASDSSSGDGGSGAFGASCTVDGDCASKMCRQFRGMTVMFCTKPCTTATAAMDCPMPPSAGTCTNNGYCKFN